MEIKFTDTRLACSFVSEKRVTEYRRGIERERHNYVLQERWHFDEACESFPTRNFVTRHDKPLIENLCRDCRSKGADS